MSQKPSYFWLLTLSFTIVAFEFWCGMNHGIWQATKDRPDPSFKSGKKEDAFVDCIWRSLVASLWRNWPTNAAFEFAAPEFGHSSSAVWLHHCMAGVFRGEAPSFLGLLYWFSFSLVVFSSSLLLPSVTESATPLSPTCLTSLRAWGKDPAAKLFLYNLL